MRTYINMSCWCMCCAYLLTLSTHVQRGLQYLVGSVCYHVFCHYVQQGSQKAIQGASVLSATQARFYVSQKLWCINRSEKPICKRYCLVSTILCHFAYCESISFQVVNQMLRSNVTYTYSYPVGTRIDRL